MDLALNNQQRFICHKPNQPTNQPSKTQIALTRTEFESPNPFTKTITVTLRAPQKSVDMKKGETV